MQRYFILTFIVAGFIMSTCTLKKSQKKEFSYFSEQFADLRILRYQIPDFDGLYLKQKELLYYLYQAGLSGRDIIYDQNFKHNLFIRRALEEIVKNYTGDRTTDEFKNFMVYVKRVWFSSGIHHHYSTIKFKPEFSKEYFTELVKNSPGASFLLIKDENLDDLIKKIIPLIFDPDIAAKRVNLDPDADLVAQSANNYYENLTQKEVEQFYIKKIDKNDLTPVSYGLNSKLIKENGVIKEKVWKIGGMYSEAIERIVYWLEKAAAVAENNAQKAALEKLIEYYKTGDLRTFDQYCILWLQDTTSSIDVINGFIEVYGDAMAYRGAFESVVSFKDKESTKRIQAIGANARWFEENSPIMPEHKKHQFEGISARVITVVAEAGDASPATPIGINLPNANWIRSNYGSKSVSIGNIVYAYDEAAKGSGFIEEFGYSQEEIDLYHKYDTLADNLHTDMHEVIGHGSGKINPGVKTPKETLKNYASTLEEARADLVALYYIMDPKLIELGLMPSLDAGKTSYNSYIRNGLMTQLTRLQLGEQLEESHMRNRQLIAKWAYDQGKEDSVITMEMKDNKTYFVINDYLKLRELFGQLLREVQRIVSEGDFEAGKELVETYGVKVDPELHQEVLERYKKLNIAPYSGFINPVLKPIMQEGKIVDVIVEYPADFSKQMLYYAQYYSFLPTYN
jgi:dipeptidyl-peptidase-3